MRRRLLRRSYARAPRAAARAASTPIYLSLHGAMVSEIDRRRRRRSAPPAPLRARPGAGSALRRLRPPRQPHRGDDAARRRAGLLSREPAYRCPRHRRARGRAPRALPRNRRKRPRMLRRSVPIIWPPTGTGTADLPMRDLEALAREIEAADPEIWAVNVVAGFSFADVADAGVAFSVVTTGDDRDGGGRARPARGAGDGAQGARPRTGDHAGRRARPGGSLCRARAGASRRAVRQYRRRRARQRHRACSARWCAAASTMPASSSTIRRRSPRSPTCRSAGRATVRHRRQGQPVRRRPAGAGGRARSSQRRALRPRGSPQPPDRLAGAAHRHGTLGRRAASRHHHPDHHAQDPAQRPRPMAQPGHRAGTTSP